MTQIIKIIALRSAHYSETSHHLTFLPSSSYAYSPTVELRCIIPTMQCRFGRTADGQIAEFQELYVAVTVIHRVIWYWWLGIDFEGYNICLHSVPGDCKPNGRMPAITIMSNIISICFIRSYHEDLHYRRALRTDSMPFCLSIVKPLDQSNKSTSSQHRETH